MLLYAAIIILALSKSGLSQTFNSSSPFPPTAPTAPAPTVPAPTSQGPPTSPPTTPPPTPPTIPPTPPPTTPPTTTETFDAEAELQKVKNLTQALSALFDAFNSTEPLGKHLKKILEASRTCGLVLYQGLSLKKIHGTQEKTNLEEISAKLSSKIAALESTISSAEMHLTFRQSIFNIQKMVIKHVESLLHSFQIVTNDFKKEDIVYFKYMCKWFHYPEHVLSPLKDRFIWGDANFTVVTENYSKNVYDNLYIIFYNSIKQLIAMYPMCNIILHGPPASAAGAHIRQQIIISTTFEVMQAFQNNFTSINNERKEKYWSNENILKIVKKFILGDITVNEPYTDDNDKIATNIYEYLAENYPGYTYHVGVSNSGTNGNVDTLIQCSTECKFIYGINNKDVYIIRNKQVPAYKECKFLTPTSENPFVCGTTRDSTDLTELAEQIQSKCNPAAFSLVRKRLKYASEGGMQRINSPSAFSQKCFGDIYVVMAKTF